MREIKFRAWDKLQNIMRPVLAVDWVKGIVVLYWGTLYEKYLSDVELLQYTGLKDKNGKEIYEGDIVRIFHRDANKATIQWSNVEGGFTLKWVTPLTEDTEGIIAHVDRRGVEVIGNIYDNPELLGGLNGDCD